MKVLLCSYYKFPNGCAGSIRHEKIAQMLMELGHEPYVAGTGVANEFKTDMHKGIAYTSLRYGGDSLADKIKTRLLFWSNLKKILADMKPQAVIMDDLGPAVTQKLKRYSKKNGIVLIHDSVEWYSKEQFKYGSLDPQYIGKDRLNKYVIDSSCRVIGISNYLTNYFSGKGIKCVNMPIVISDEDLVAEKVLDEKIKFLYAGQPGKKDYLHVMLEAMAALSDEERARFTFHILGCTKDQLLAAGMDAETLKIVESSVVAHGRVPRSEVLEALKTADFTILMRSPVQRYAKAGFPTKMVESLSHSTPIIANLTSDMHLYLKDEINSLVVEDCTPEALAKVLKKAISMPKGDREEMCRNAYKTAAEELHYKKFLPAIEDILN